jgi:hypothetical protein
MYQAPQHNPKERKTAPESYLIWFNRLIISVVIILFTCGVLSSIPSGCMECNFELKRYLFKIYRVRGLSMIIFAILLFAIRKIQINTELLVHHVYILLSIVLLIALLLAIVSYTEERSDRCFATRRNESIELNCSL